MASMAIPDLTATNNLTGGVNPTIVAADDDRRRRAADPDADITSVPNSAAALTGNNAQVRVIIDGSKVATGPTDIGFVIDASN